MAERCAFRDVVTGERVCLRTDRHDCEVAAKRLANRCTRTDVHYCQLGRHTQRRVLGKAF